MLVCLKENYFSEPLRFRSTPPLTDVLYLVGGSYQVTNFTSVYGSSTLQPSRKTTAPEHSSVNADGGTSLEGGTSSRGIVERGHLLSTKSRNSLKPTSAENPGPGGCQHKGTFGLLSPSLGRWEIKNTLLAE